MTDTFRLAFDATATPLELTGAGYYVKQLLHELDKRDTVDVTIITRKGDMERFAAFAPHSHIIETAPAYMPARVAYQTTVLGKLVDSLNVDVFHGPHYQLPLKINTPSVVTVHDLTFLTHPDVHTRLKKIFFSRIIPQALNKARSVITVSQHTADDLNNIFTVHSKTFVAPLGIDNERFHPNKNENDKKLLASRGIMGDYIAFLGLIEPRKSIPTLIQAFANIADSYPTFRLVIAGGQGWGISEVRDAIRDSGVATRIVLPGRLTNEEVGPYLRNACVFVYPSIYEGFGMPVAEAMACGAPTITSRSSSLQEVAGEGALLVEPGNVDELTKALESLLGNTNLRSELSNKACEQSKRFSWSTCADKHMDAYHFALNKSEQIQV